MTTTIRIATRKSPLALWQAEHVAACLRAIHPGITVELVKMTTRGDQILDAPLAKVGGKGLFVKELEQGLLDGRADIAVHSMKDVPVTLPPGLHIGAILAREDPRDAFVSQAYPSLDDLPDNARIGTSSLRRQCQLLQRFPGWRITPLRGNVGTRMAKLEAGEYDGIILAVAGLKRLGWADKITQIIAPELSLPAIGQGAVGIECRKDDPTINELIAPLHHKETAICVTAERSMNERLEGGCQVPIAGFSEIDGECLTLRGRVGNPDGSEMIAAQATGVISQAQWLGESVAETLLARGADRILHAVYHG